MSKLIINGGKKLKGEVKISGMKNAATPILAAALLSEKECIIDNVPDITDVGAMMQILESLGKKIIYKNHCLIVSPGAISLKNLNIKLVKKMRSSILLLGPLLSKLGVVSLPEPGGCIIGKRPIDTHLYVLKKLGAKAGRGKKNIFLSAKNLIGATVILPEFSVTATENLIMAAVLARGRTTIKLAAIEPHIEDLIKFLNKLGARIRLVAPHTIIIDGVRNLGGARHTVIPDNIEAGTFIAAALITGGRLLIKGVRHNNLDAVYSLLERIGVTLLPDGNNLTVYAAGKLKCFKLQTMPYPGFPTDLQAPFGVLATRCLGTSLIHDPLYENRLGYLNELERMGANVTICDPHRALITGPTKLRGTIIRGLDLRAGATLVLAGLAARGITVVEGVENLDRGYENFDGRLRKLGAEIERID